MQLLGVNPEVEEFGLDSTQHGERAYGDECGVSV
jgi:hypothetical protein